MPTDWYYVGPDKTGHRCPYCCDAFKATGDGCALDCSNSYTCVPGALPQEGANGVPPCWVYGRNSPTDPYSVSIVWNTRYHGGFVSTCFPSGAPCVNSAGWVVVSKDGSGGACSGYRGSLGLCPAAAGCTGCQQTFRYVQHGCPGSASTSFLPCPSEGDLCANGDVVYCPDGPGVEDYTITTYPTCTSCSTCTTYTTNTAWECTCYCTEDPPCPCGEPGCDPCAQCINHSCPSCNEAYLPFGGGEPDDCACSVPVMNCPSGWLQECRDCGGTWRNHCYCGPELANSDCCQTAPSHYDITRGPTGWINAFGICTPCHALSNDAGADCCSRDAVAYIRKGCSTNSDICCPDGRCYSKSDVICRTDRGPTVRYCK